MLSSVISYLPMSTAGTQYLTILKKYQAYVVWNKDKWINIDLFSPSTFLFGFSVRLCTTSLLVYSSEELLVNLTTKIELFVIKFFLLFYTSRAITLVLRRRVAATGHQVICDVLEISLKSSEVDLDKILSQDQILYANASILISKMLRKWQLQRDTAREYTNKITVWRNFSICIASVLFVQNLFVNPCLESGISELTRELRFIT